MTDVKNCDQSKIFNAPKNTIDLDQSKSWLKRAMPIVMSHKKYFITALICSFIGLVIQVQVPDLLNKALDNSIVFHKVPLHFYVYWVIALAIGAGIAGFISRYFMFKTAYLIEYDLRHIIFEHFNKLSFKFYDKVQSGQLISRANSDIRSVQMYLTFAPMIIVQSLIAVVAFVYMLKINVELAIIAMIVMPGVYFVGVAMRNSMFPISWVIQARLAEVATIVDENVSGVRVVKAFGAEKRQLDELSDAARRLEWSYIKDADIRAKFTPLIQNIPQIGVVLVLVFGGYLVIHAELGIGAIVAFNSYLLMLQAPFMMLGMLIMMGQRAAASAERIYEVLEQESEIMESPSPILLDKKIESIEFKDVSFSYDEELVLTNINLKLIAPATVAIVGRTGCGKSSLVKLIPRFYDPQSGAIEANDVNIKEIKLSDLRSRIAYVPDEPFLFSTTVMENIAYQRPDASADEVIQAAKYAMADDFIRELDDGYLTVVGERGYSLSGGQRQRIALARAFVANCDVLILDDATSSVDVETEQKILNNIKSYSTNLLTVIVAHRLSTINLSDWVVFMEKGRIIATGTHEYLMQNVDGYRQVISTIKRWAN
jgi:ATP-binding cassette subfamily B protein